MADLEIFRKTLGSMGTNCYILVNHDTLECVLFDPGDQANVLKEALDENGFVPKAIILTHGHFDHIGAVKEIQDAYQIPLYCSKEENDEILGKLSGNMSTMIGQPVTLQADEFVRDGQALEIIGTTLQCIATPGHTIGGMCFYNEQLKSVIVGDTLFAGSVGRTDFPTGSTSQLMNSIVEKLYVLPDDTKVFPGHMDSTTIGYEKKTNMMVGPVL